MVFVAKQVRHNVPPRLADHLAKNWRHQTPHEPVVIVLEPGLLFPENLNARRHDGAGNWFVGNLEESETK